MRSPASSDARSAPFDLESLALALASADSRLVVWKGGGDLASQGDLDCSAPRDSWPAVARAFETWSRSQGFAVAVTCEHALGRLILVGCGGSARDRLLQVDLVDTLIVHGAPVWTAHDASTATASTRGVPHTQPGAEGLLRRLADRADGRSAALIAADPAVAGDIAHRLGLRGRLALRSRARWTGAALEAILLVRPFLHPVSLVRARRSAPAIRTCPVLRALRNDRTLDRPLEAWLGEVAARHPVRRLDGAA